MTLQSVSIALVFAGALFAPGVAADSFTSLYTIVDLGTLGGTESFAYALNNRGDVVGLSRVHDGDTHAFHYRDRAGVMTDLSPLNSESILTSSMDINKHRQIASGVIENGVYVPAIYEARSGQVTTLGTLGGVTAFGFNGVATAINDGGQAVGYSYLDSLNRHAFLFSDGEMTDIGSLGGYSGALAINNSGAIAGFSSDTSVGYPHAFVYRDGLMMEIDPFGGPNNESIARGINNHDQVVGEALTPAGTFNGFIYSTSNGLVTNVGTLAGGLNTYALSINDRGDVVGSADSPYESVCFTGGQSVPCIEYALRAFLYRNGEMLDLNSLIRSDSGWDLQWALDINDRGQIIGYGVRNGKFRAFLATPVPERTLTLPLAEAGRPR